MTDDADDNSDTDWGLVLPFLTDDPAFAHGVEVGMLYEKMKGCDFIEGMFLTANQEQITLMANRLGWVIDNMASSLEGWFTLKMHRRAATL